MLAAGEVVKRGKGHVTWDVYSNTHCHYKIKTDLGILEWKLQRQNKYESTFFLKISWFLIIFHNLMINLYILHNLFVWGSIV